MTQENSNTGTPVLARVNYQIAREGNPTIYIDPDGQIGKRIDPEYENAEIALEDARSGSAPDFAANSFEFRQQETAVVSFEDQEIFRPVYDPETENLIKDVSGAVEVVIFDHTIRTDNDSIRRPARHVHGDYSAKSGPVRLHEVLDEERAREWEAGHFGIINVWRPIGNPVETAPLAFADPLSVGPDDWTDIDMIYPDRVGQISGLKRNEAHRWVFLSEMGPDEAVVFNVYDSKGKAAVGHSAADLVNPRENARPRQSIETRALVRYA